MKQHRVEGGASHLGAVDADQPGPRPAVPEQQGVLAVVPGVALPAFPAGFACVRLVVAVEGQPLVVASHAAHALDRHIGGRWGRGEESLGIVEPALFFVEVLCGNDFCVDSFERFGVGGSAQQAEAAQQDFVAECLRREPDGGAGHR